MHPRIHLLTIGVSKLEKAAVFYENLFGVTRSPQSQDAVVFMKLPGLALSLFNVDSLAEDAGVENDCGKFRGFSIAYNAASEPEVDSVFNRALEFGATKVKVPQKVFWGGYSSYVADFDGNLIEIAYNPFFPFAADGSLDI